jgi:hypothetical protein
MKCALLSRLHQKRLRASKSAANRNDVFSHRNTLLNALDADRDLFAAEVSLARTRRDELLALVQLYKALGGGWRQ